MNRKNILLTCGLCAVLLLNVYYYRDYIYQVYLYYKLRNQHIVVSLTTTPHRIKLIEPFLETITKQLAPISAIYINIPYYFARDNSEYEIPEFITNNKSITVLRTKDYGPGTKLLGVLEQADLPKDAIIITVDDDVYYPRTLVLHLAHASMQHPKSAIGLRGANLVYTEDGRIDTKHELGHAITSKANAIVNIMQGYSGVAYRKEFFDSDVFDLMAAPRECFVSDDLYLSYYLAYNGIERRVLRNNLMHACKINWRTDIGTDEHALHNITVDHPRKTQICLDYLQEVMPLDNF